MRPGTSLLFVWLLGVVAARPAAADPWWLTPIERLLATTSFDHEAARPYSVPARPRQVAGVVALSCEHEEGRPCGDGAGLGTEVDSATGYGDRLVARVRLRASTGTNAHDADLAIDRAYVRGMLGPLALEAGRDVLVLGPGAVDAGVIEDTMTMRSADRTQLGWGDDAPPLDHVRLSTARPLTITRDVHARLLYLVGRLRAPQTYPGTIVTIARGELAIGPAFQLGMMQLLELEGQGAPHLGPLDFVLEHVRRRNRSAGPDDTSNRRLGFDIAGRIAALDNARLAYQLVFEDVRRHVLDAVRYDADHLIALDVHGLAIEWQKTGGRSQEHFPRTTGFTHAGRVVGSPLGPDAQALFVGVRTHLRSMFAMPWAEVARLASDRYTYVDYGPITRTPGDLAEWRMRGGALVAMPVGAHVTAELAGRLERIWSFAFVDGATRTNAGITAAVVWRP